eukprot:TRINITY_DN57_c0_g2_i3.p1 TRINITY_DN57_c0_g2~~TRINITY_DN57_c0_g2_i3.p1  ORF type:complete len:196 (-),score=20.92 TRINITY_DN57_c0_g2_i3:2297-2884(-)
MLLFLCTLSIASYPLHKYLPKRAHERQPASRFKTFQEQCKAGVCLDKRGIYRRTLRHKCMETFTMRRINGVSINPTERAERSEPAERAERAEPAEHTDILRKEYRKEPQHGNRKSGRRRRGRRGGRGRGGRARGKQGEAVQGENSLCEHGLDEGVGSEAGRGEGHRGEGRRGEGRHNKNERRRGRGRGTQSVVDG